jgi:hypothetical protein
VINDKNAVACVGSAHHACGTCANDKGFNLHTRQVP